MPNRNANTPIDWNQTGDTAYTWYKDTSLLNILPTGKTLTYDEVTAYYPVTAHTFDGFEVRADGDVNFTYRIVTESDQSYNSHQLFLDTENNTGNSQQVSYIKLVAYSGTSAYSATTILTKNPNTIEKRMYLQANGTTAGSGDTGACVSVIAQNCVFAGFEITSTGGNWTPIPTLTKRYSDICAEFEANTGRSRSATYSITLKDTDDNSYNVFFVLTQEEAGEPEPEPPSPPDTGDTGYTWYEDASLLNILPTARTLAYDERQAYFPITAHTMESLDLQAVGDVSFTYNITEAGTDPDYSSHSLWITTYNNTGDTRQESSLTLVGYKGTSAYTANAYLFKNPESHAYVTALPNPVNANAGQNTIATYLSLTNCNRSIEDELTGNTQLADWITVDRISNTAISFTFAANTGGTPRSTYYMAYGRNSDNQLVYERIDLNQDGNQMALTITPSRSSLSKEAGSFTCAINSTEDGNFTFSAASWMVITSYSATTNHSGTLYLNYYQNNNEWARTGDIKVFQQISVSPYTLSAFTTVSQAINSGETATLTVNPTAVTLTRQSGYTEFEVTYRGLASAPGVLEGAGNMNITSFIYAEGIFTVIYGENNSSVPKTKSFIITASTLDGSILSQEVELRQNGTGLPLAPVWRDYVLDLPTPGMSYVNYSISKDGTVIYTGRAYAYPGKNGVEIYFNHLVKSFLANHIDFEPGYQTIDDWLGDFTITSPELGDITSVAFYEDYSYENRVAQEVMSLNNPITHEVPEGGLVPLSFFITGETATVQIRTNKRINE